MRRPVPIPPTEAEATAALSAVEVRHADEAIGVTPRGAKSDDGIIALEIRLNNAQSQKLFERGRAQTLTIQFLDGVFTADVAVEVDQVDEYFSHTLLVGGKMAGSNIVVEPVILAGLDQSLDCLVVIDGDGVAGERKLGATN